MNLRPIDSSKVSLTSWWGATPAKRKDGVRERTRQIAESQLHIQCTLYIRLNQTDSRKRLSFRSSVHSSDHSIPDCDSKGQLTSKERSLTVMEERKKDVETSSVPGCAVSYHLSGKSLCSCVPRFRGEEVHLFVLVFAVFCGPPLTALREGKQVHQPRERR